MGVQVSLKDIAAGFLSAAAHTANNTLIEDALNKSLDRTASVDNAMEVDFDMGDNKIINLAAGVLNSDAVNVAQMNGAISLAGSGLISSQTETQKGSAAVSRVFTFSGLTYVIGANNLEVFRNGQRLGLGRDYTETSTSSITLTFDPNASDDFDFRTNTATTNSTTTTAAITHASGGTDHNLATYLQGLVLEFDTMAEAVASDKLYVGAVLLIKNRANSHWDVVLASGVTPNTYNIVQCTGVGTLALVLRVDDVANLKAFGAVGDGTTNDWAPIQIWVTYIIANQVVGYAPSGTYIIGTGGATQDIRIAFTANDQNFKMYGDGPTSIFKEADGKNASVGAFTRMFFVYLNAANLDVGVISVKDIFFDKNGRSNGTPATPFLWEQSHCFSIVDSDGSSTIRQVDFQNVTVDDRVGAGLHIGGQVTITKSVNLINCHDGDNFQTGVIGKRGMFEINPNCPSVNFTNCTADYAQIELEVAETKTATNRLITRMTNCDIDTIEYTANDDGGADYTWLHLVNTDVRTNLTVTYTSCTVNGGVIQFPSAGFAPAKMTVNNAEVTFSTSDGTSINSIYVRDIGSFVKNVDFSDCRFLIDYSGSVTATQYVFNSAADTTTPDNCIVTVKDSTFDSRFASICDAYASNNYTFEGNALACSSHAFRVGGYSTYAGKLRLKNNDYRNVGGAALLVVNSNSDWRLWFDEIGDVADLYIGTSTSLSTVNATQCPIRPTLLGATAPVANGYLRGTKLYYIEPSASSYVGEVCTTTGTTGGTWKTFGVTSA